MKISIHPHQTRVSEEMRELITRHVRRALEMFENDIPSVRVELADINGPRSGGVDKRCYITASVPGIGDVRAQSSAATLMSAAITATRRIKRKLLASPASSKLPAA